MKKASRSSSNAKLAKAQALTGEQYTVFMSVVFHVMSTLFVFSLLISILSFISLFLRFLNSLSFLSLSLSHRSKVFLFFFSYSNTTNYILCQPSELDH